MFIIYLVIYMDAEIRKGPQGAEELIRLKFQINLPRDAIVLRHAIVLQSVTRILRERRATEKITPDA